MWKCLKCNREFKHVNQSHYCSKAENIDDYIASQPEHIQRILQKVRVVIQSVAPNAEETIKWGMPYFTVVGENLCGFAAQKKHISFFPGEAAVIEFGIRLEGYKASKGTIQLPYDKPLDEKLIADMIRWRLDSSQV